MKRLLLLLPVAALLSSCGEIIRGEGELTTATYPNTDFNRISVGLPADLHYIQGANYAVEIRAQQNILDAITIHQQNHSLDIDTRHGVLIRHHKDVTIYITTPDIEKLSLSGSGAIYSDGQVAVKKLELAISGSGDIHMNEVVADQLSASISGSGDLDVLSGEATATDFHISGSGSISAAGLSAHHAATRISGSGDIRLFATETLTAHISGSGDVLYRGNPIIQVQSSGSGKVLPITE